MVNTDDWSEKWIKYHAGDSEGS
ncbi:MAG: hypothetical protein H6Q06_381, partial [Acidobacteria bacterium]|nr:hypothetical protein [Acidobacteriota bacterium]